MERQIEYPRENKKMVKTNAVCHAKKSNCFPYNPNARMWTLSKTGSFPRIETREGRKIGEASMTKSPSRDWVISTPNLPPKSTAVIWIKDEERFWNPENTFGNSQNPATRQARFSSSRGLRVTLKGIE